MEIRAAREDEMNILLEFEQGIVAAERPYDTTLRNGEIHYYDLLALIKSPDATVLVAILDDEVVGSGYAQIRKADTYLKHTSFAHLGFMYVKPTHRGKGVNQAILEALKDWARSKNISEIRLDVYYENIIAKNAYLKAGFTPNLLQMRIEV